MLQDRSNTYEFTSLVRHSSRALPLLHPARMHLRSAA
jgi:hypothetical protein